MAAIMAEEKFLQAAARRRVVENWRRRWHGRRRSGGARTAAAAGTAEALRKLDRIMSAKLGGEAAEQGEQRRQSGSRSSRGAAHEGAHCASEAADQQGATRPAAEDEENDPLRLPKRRQMSVDRPPRESSMARSRSRTPTNLMNNTTPRSDSKSKQQQPTTVTTPKSSKTSRSPRRRGRAAAASKRKTIQDNESERCGLIKKPRRIVLEGRERGEDERENSVTIVYLASISAAQKAVRRAARSFLTRALFCWAPCARDRET